VAYITTADLSQRLGPTLYARLTDRTNGTTLNNTVGQQIVDEAEAEANSYLSKRYATPVNMTQHPELADVLALRVLDLAEYMAWKSSPFVSDIPGRVKAVHEDARRWLERVAAGAVHLPASSPPAASTAEDDSPRYSGRTRAFTEDELDGL